MTDKEKVNVTNHNSVDVIPWLAAFVAIKLYGTALAAWSWWWILAPSIPILVLGLSKIGLLN